MGPERQVQRILAEVHEYGAGAVVSLLPHVTALQSALYLRMLALGQQAALPDIDRLLTTEDIASRLGKSTKWVRDNVESLPFAFLVGKEHRFSARGLEEWIAEQRAARMPSALPPQRRQQ